MPGVEGKEGGEGDRVSASPRGNTSITRARGVGGERVARGVHRGQWRSSRKRRVHGRYGFRRVLLEPNHYSVVFKLTKG